MTGLVAIVIAMLIILLVTLTGAIIGDLFYLRKQLREEQRNLELLRSDLGEAAEQAAHIIHILNTQIERYTDERTRVEGSGETVNGYGQDS